MIQLVKSSFIIFIISSISALAASIIGNIVAILIATIELCFSEGCSGIVNLYISLLLEWSNWDYVFIFYIKVLGILYIHSLIIVLNENNLKQKDKSGLE